MTDNQVTIAKNQHNDETMIVNLRTNYVQDKMFNLTIVLLLQLGLIACLVLFILLQIASVPKAMFFQATERQQIIRPVSLDAPGMTSAEVLNWSVEAMRITFSFNYRSINYHIPKISPYFDERGMTKFFEMITSDQRMKQVKPDKLIVSMQIKEAPKIVKEGKIDDRYAWRVTMPIEARFENATILRRQELDIDLYIWRVPETASPIGIKITNFNMVVKKEFEVQDTKSVKSFL